MNSNVHIPVMAREVLEWLAPEPGRRYLDGTLGLGGHARVILQKTAGAARILGIDKDEQALHLAGALLAENGYADSVHVVQGSFAHFDDVLSEVGWPDIDGAVLDLGFSSWQLDDPKRGMSFLLDGPLDMRLDQAGTRMSARDLVNSASYEQLRNILKEYGQEPMAGRIARAIVSRREQEAINSTADLAALIRRAYPAKRRFQSRKHPATKSFQALRIAVNSELDDLELFLRKIPGYVRSGGRIVVISFHSLEDRMVKQWFRYHARECVCPSEHLYCRCEHRAEVKVLTKKPLTPLLDEIEGNFRSRSAKLRVAEVL